MPQKKQPAAAPVITVLPPPDAPAPAADAATPPPADAPYQVPAKTRKKRGSKADPVPPPVADPNPLLLTESEPTMPPAAPEPGQEGPAPGRRSRWRSAPSVCKRTRSR
jgi:hypothetical protein